MPTESHSDSQESEGQDRASLSTRRPVARRRERGRKTKLTPEVQEKIVLLVTNGHYKRVAAQQAGVDERTLYQWIEKGDPTHPMTRAIYRQFRQALEKAEADSEVVLLDKIMKHGTARDHLEVLARRFPERWARKIGIEATGPGSTPDNPIHHQHGHTGTGIQIIIGESGDAWQPDDDPGYFELDVQGTEISEGTPDR